VLASAVGAPVGGRAVGAAPGARWAAALSNPDNGYNSVLMALAADWMLFEARPDVLLGAWGHGRGSCDDRDRWLIEAFRAAGTTPVFAAGNDGPTPSSGQAPATLAGLFPDGRGPLSIGAVDRNDRVIPESARGPRPCGGPPIFPELAAPGWLLPVPDAGRPEDLTLGSGTSIAVGWAGGVIALVLQAAPEMPVEVVERVVRTSARDLPPEGPDDASGHGMIDPRAAVEAAREWSARERARRR
jgi:bacillopeptidase F